MRPSESAWRELVDRLLDAAEEKPGGYKKMYFMEKLGFQDHTVYSFCATAILWTLTYGRLMNSQTKETSGDGSLDPTYTSPLMGNLTPAPSISCKSMKPTLIIFTYEICLGFQLCQPRCSHLKIGSFSPSSSTRGRTWKHPSWLLLPLNGTSGHSCLLVPCSSVVPTLTLSESVSINILL